MGVDIVVLDAIMGNGKTARIKEMIMLEDRPVLYITPFLDEASVVVGAITDENGNHMKDDSGYYMYDQSNPVSTKSFMLPNNGNNNGSKVDDVVKLIDRGFNISSTHNLFSLMDLDVVAKIREKKYVLIVDEALNVWSNLSLYDCFISGKSRQVIEAEKADHDAKGLTKTDREILNLIANGAIEVDPIGMLHWQDDVFKIQDDLLYAPVKRLCDMKQLYLSNGKVVFWELNSLLIQAFSKIIIGTYMFEHSFMAHYLDVHNLAYTVEKFGKKPSFYKDFINIKQGRVNSVGDKDYSLSYSDLCVKRHSGEHPKNILRKNLHSLMSSNNTHAGQRIWTCFKKPSELIGGKNYSTDWIAYNTKATNKFRHVENVAYMCNNFPNTFLVAMVTRRSGNGFNSDLWALSEMLQYIWRSRIRGGGDERNINLYVPSKRMRTLLENWLDDKYEDNE